MNKYQLGFLALCVFSGYGLCSSILDSPLFSEYWGFSVFVFLLISIQSFLLADYWECVGKTVKEEQARCKRQLVVEEQLQGWIPAGEPYDQEKETRFKA